MQWTREVVCSGDMMDSIYSTEEDMDEVDGPFESWWIKSTDEEDSVTLSALKCFFKLATKNHPHSLLNATAG